MGILGALSTAVSGLSAQSYALENISGNIANSQTVGFKRVDTNFVDLIPDAPITQEAAGSVAAYSALTNSIQGTIRNTGIPTNMALSGDGYFVVAKNQGSVAVPNFTGENVYTRRGDFRIDSSGHLVNGANRYLIGTTYNPATGAVIGSSRTPMKLPQEALPAKQSTEILYSGNLPALPHPEKYSSTTPGSHLLQPTDFTTNPVTTGTVVASDTSAFLRSSIPAGEITVYSPAGTAASAQLRWAKVAETGATNTWMMFYQTSSTATGGATAWQSIGGNVTFDASGQRTSPATQTIAGMTIDGIAVGNINMNFGAGRLTQYGAVEGLATPTLDQDGYAFGTLAGVAVGSDGALTGTYSNGRIAKLAQVAVVHFPSGDALKREDGGTFSVTLGSGTPTQGLLGTTLSGGAVEESNTDISEEFSKMIVTQQAYSANTRVMSTAQQMLQDVINIVR